MKLGFIGTGEITKAVVIGILRSKLKVKKIYLSERNKKISSFLRKKNKNVQVEKIPNLRPSFSKDGTATAANSSTINDGAAAVVLMSEDKAKSLGIKPMAMIISQADASVEPKWFTTAPAKALPIAIKKADITIDQIDYFELNEAFSSQSLAVIKELNLNKEIINVNGGAISLGHPLGCTGTKLSVQIFDEMRKRKSKYGMVTMCVGTGQGAAGIFEFLN